MLLRLFIEINNTIGNNSKIKNSVHGYDDRYDLNIQHF